MPVTIASADVGKTAAGRGSKVVLCGCRAGIVQQDIVMQLGSDPCCMSGSQPVQGLPAPTATWACPCICAAIEAFDTT
jgi:hypothetical protein